MQPLKYALPNIGVGLALLLYIGLSLYQLELPGLHYDEAFEVVPTVQLLQGQPVTAFRESGLWLGGRLWPLMTQDYIGAINTYVSLPLIALLGPTPLAVRLAAVLLGGLTLGLAAHLTRQMTGQAWAGTATALLLAVQPTFIFWNRQGVFVTAITATIGVGVAVCGWNRWQTGQRRWSLAAAFLVGLGLYAKLLFIWLVAAFIGATLLLNLSRLKRWLLSLPQHRAEIGAGLLAFGLGCWPLLLYNLQTGGTVANVTDNAGTSYYGVDNLAVVSNLLTRLSQFQVMLDGSHLWYLGRVVAWPLNSIGLGLIVGTIVVLATRNKLAHPLKLALWPMLVISLVIGCSIITVSNLWVTHFALLMPWPTIAGVVGGWAIVRLAWEQRPWVRPLLVAGLGVLVVSNLAGSSLYHQALTESGGLSTHSDAIYKLSGWLDEQAGQPVMAMDWGLAAPVTYLTNGRVQPIELFGYSWQPDANLSRRLTQAIAQPDTLYLWRGPDEIIFDRSDTFKDLYRPLNLVENIEAAFYERNGRPILGVTRLVPTDTPNINVPLPLD